ncbi:MAG: hypothetical protein WB441_15005, partial [Nocardioidaceae bacterium]
MPHDSHRLVRWCRRTSAVGVAAAMVAPVVGVVDLDVTEPPGRPRPDLPVAAAGWASVPDRPVA